MSVVLLSVLLSGCVSGERDGMDMQGAAERSDVILDAVLDEVQPAVRWTHGPTTTGGCEVSRRRTVMTVISPERRGSFLGLVDRFWRKGEYRLEAINNDEEFPAIYAQTQDGFVVSLRFGGEGQAFFRVDSPCVEKSEVADSTTKPTAPTYEGMEHIPRPNIRSAFWSAGAS
ncbi:hypothetical protein [Streptomyces sp. NPDC058620]|uniref:hypothetical protein n=1 Tax=Streptomyces sp. NPDC058620 TaxID=3346560 RepID=UPI00364D248A